MSKRFYRQSMTRSGDSYKKVLEMGERLVDQFNDQNPSARVQLLLVDEPLEQGSTLIDLHFYYWADDALQGTDTLLWDEEDSSAWETDARLHWFLVMKMNREAFGGD